jgi:hypothetical protein
VDVPQMLKIWKALKRCKAEQNCALLGY